MKFFVFSWLFFFSLAVQAKVKKGFADSTHDQISQSILNLSNRIDSFFGDKRMDDESNKTRVRFYTLTTLRESELPFTEGNIKVQLVLPRTQKRLQLVLEREDSRGQTADDDQTRPTSATQRDKTVDDVKNTTTAAFRFLLDRSGINFSADAGVRLNVPPQMYARARFRKNSHLGEWIFRPVEEIVWVDREGFSSNTDLNFDKKLNETWLFRIVNSINWNDSDYILAFQNGPVWFQKITEKIGMSYSAYIISRDTPSMHVENYSLNVGYRQLLYKTWFFWEFTPSLTFPRENQFHRTPSATIKFEIIAGRI